MIKYLQIPASKVDFWKLHDQNIDLEMMSINRMYPPRFKLILYGRNAIEPAAAQIIFTGSIDESLNTDIFLEPNTGMRMTYY